MAKKQTIVAKARERRDALHKAKNVDPPSLTPQTRKLIVRLLEEGATLAEIVTRRGITSQGSLYRARAADPEFDQAVREALAQGAAQAIADAAELSRDAAESANPDDMRVAEAFHRCALGYAEKVAPRDYGQLVKLGNPDGGALSLSVVNYAVPAIEGKFQRVEDAHARELTHAEPLDPSQ